MSEFEKFITPKTKFVSIVHASNSLGTINPVKEIVEILSESITFRKKWFF